MMVFKTLHRSSDSLFLKCWELGHICSTVLQGISHQISSQGQRYYTAFWADLLTISQINKLPGQLNSEQQKYVELVKSTSNYVHVLKGLSSSVLSPQQTLSKLVIWRPMFRNVLNDQKIVCSICYSAALCVAWNGSVDTALILYVGQSVLSLFQVYTNMSQTTLNKQGCSIHRP